MAKSKSKRAKPRSRDANANPSTSLIVYRGPIRLPDTGVPHDETTIELGYVFPINGSSSLGAQGTITTASVVNSLDWARLILLYDEYRVLGFQATWRPHYGWGNTNVNHGTGLWVTTHNPTTLAPFTSLNQMMDYQDWSEFHTGRPSAKEWKMASTEESQFTAVGSVTSQGTIAFFVPTATTSGVPYGNIYTVWRVQFRGRS